MHKMVHGCSNRGKEGECQYIHVQWCWVAVQYTTVSVIVSPSNHNCRIVKALLIHCVLWSVMLQIHNSILHSTSLQLCNTVYSILLHANLASQGKQGNKLESPFFYFHRQKGCLSPKWDSNLHLLLPKWDSNHHLLLSRLQQLSHRGSPTGMVQITQAIKAKHLMSPGKQGMNI